MVRFSSIHKISLFDLSLSPLFSLFLDLPPLISTQSPSPLHCLVVVVVCVVNRTAIVIICQNERVGRCTIYSIYFVVWVHVCVRVCMLDWQEWVCNKMFLAEQKSLFIYDFTSYIERTWHTRRCRWRRRRWLRVFYFYLKRENCFACRARTRARIRVVWAYAPSCSHMHKHDRTYWWYGEKVLAQYNNFDFLSRFDFCLRYVVLLLFSSSSWYLCIGECCFITCGIKSLVTNEQNQNERRSRREKWCVERKTRTYGHIIEQKAIAYFIYLD